LSLPFNSYLEKLFEVADPPSLILEGFTLEGGMFTLKIIFCQERR